MLKRAVFPGGSRGLPRHDEDLREPLVRRQRSQPSPGGAREAASLTSRLARNAPASSCFTRGMGGKSFFFRENLAGRDARRLRPSLRAARGPVLPSAHSPVARPAPHVARPASGLNAA